MADIKKSGGRVLNWILFICFVIIIIVPGINDQFNLHLDKFANREKRVLAVRPDFIADSIASFPKKYDRYYNDNFSFRNFFIKLNSDFTAKTYGESSIPDVLIGTDGWLYYVAKSQGNSLEDYMGRIRVDLATLELIRNKLEVWSQNMKSKGIDFLVVIPPDKQTVYPEYLPESVKRPRRYPTRLDQILEHMADKSSMTILDVRQLILTKKSQAHLPLYFKTDTHWNNFGAFISYQKMMRSLGITPKNEEDFQWTQNPGYMGDLAQMMAYDATTKEPNAIEFRPLFKDPVSFQKVEKDYRMENKKSIIIATNEDHKLPKLVFIHDSFGDAIFPFTSYHFRESIFVDSNTVTPEEIDQIISQENPDVVIFEVVERYAPSLQWW